MQSATELAARLEKGKSEHLTHEQILRITARRGFHVSRNYRDDRLRRKTYRMQKWGLLEGGRGAKYGDGHSYTITPLGLAVLKEMEHAV